MSLDNDIKFLARVPLFSAMDHEALRLMAFAAEKRNLQAGVVLFRRGDLGDGGFMIISGVVALEAPDRGNGGARSAGPGTLIGEHALLAEVRRPQTATVREPSSVLMISRALFTRVLHEYPNNARGVRRFWAQHLYDRLSSLKNGVRP